MKKEKKQGYETAGAVEQIPVADILPNPQQPRKSFDREKLLELSESIAENGILQPLIVTMRDGRPVLLAGERRLRAAKIAGLRTVPCVLREADDMKQALLALIENLQREDMNCFETAAGLRSLIDTYGLTQDEAALRLGLSQSAVANKLRLLRLSPTEQKTVLENGMGERHARALLRLQKPEERQYALSEMARRHLNVAQSSLSICLRARARGIAASFRCQKTCGRFSTRWSTRSISSKRAASPPCPPAARPPPISNVSSASRNPR